MGFGGINIHSCTGMATEYLSDEFFSCVETCIRKAESENMLTWLYDEDRWPSGSAGGLVTRNQRFRERFLCISRNEPAEETLAVYDIVLNSDGTLAKSRRINNVEAAEGFKLYASVKIADESPWYNGQTYLNTLDPAAVREFIRITYDAYSSAVGVYFGTSVPAIFTDEPHSPPKDMFSSAFDSGPVRDFRFMAAI